MEARAAVREGRFESSSVVKLMVAVFAIFLLGGAGGYVVRGLSIPTSTNAGPVQETVEPAQQQVPYSTPNTPARPQQTLDPEGYPI